MGRYLFPSRHGSVLAECYQAHPVVVRKSAVRERVAQESVVQKSVAQESKTAGERTRRLGAVLVFAGLLAACERSPAMPHTELSAGASTVFDATRDAFSQPLPWLRKNERSAFFVGNSFFNLNWVSAPSSVADRDGLGPLYNARSCSSCHFKDGRSCPPEDGTPLSSMLLRISIPGKSEHGGPLGDPIYGDQIQGSALNGLAREAKVWVEYRERPGRFPDGEKYSLREPHYRLTHWGYGKPSPDLQLSPRVAPAIVGMGLLEAVPEELIVERADPDDANGDGISGRPNRVWDSQAGKEALGRFGWKAEQPSVLQQVSGAFLGDMGLTSRVFSAENHTKGQPSAWKPPSGGAPEVSDAILQAVASYARSLAVPARRNVHDAEISRGEDLFARLGCATCHVPSLRTMPLAALPGLPEEEIHPYTDLLLHDMGDGLADDRPSFAADGREWRTPPLWGLGLVQLVNEHSTLLHDGRARTATEAILWHDGEARAARVAFMRLTGAERDALIAFLKSL